MISGSLQFLKPSEGDLFIVLIFYELLICLFSFCSVISFNPSNLYLSSSHLHTRSQIWSETIWMQLVYRLSYSATLWIFLILVVRFEESCTDELTLTQHLSTFWSNNSWLAELARGLLYKRTESSFELTWTSHKTIIDQITHFDY